jgi:TolB-like protein/Flp pilus assembly protein TadD
MSGDAREPENGQPDAPKASSAVFISYASQDKAVADAVCGALESAGVACWIAPRNVTPGEFYAESIVHAIDSAKVIVLVLSQNGAASQHVLREVERASSKRHPVVSLRIDAAPLPAGLEYFLNTSQWLDASATGVERALSRLVDAVTSALAQPSALARSAPVPLVKKRTSLRRSGMLVASALIVAAGLAYFAVDKFWLSKRAPPGAAESTTSPAAATVPEKSIAVLPFVDMSEKHDQEYFSDGLTEELIDHLAHAPDLKVIARTSCFYFKGKQATIAEIAKTLEVSHVLEGSVRKSGNALRITAQLIRASDGVHVWSQTFDRNLVEIFRVQTELAGTVAKALEVALTMGERNSGFKESTPEAYALRLEADFISRRVTKADTERAIGLYRQALALDPQYAHAWANLGSTYLDLLNYGMVGSESIAAVVARARDALNHALRFDPNLGAAYRLKGDIASLVDWNWPGAEAAFFRASELDPSFYAEASMAFIWRAYGRVGESIQAFHRALSRDPISTGILWSLGWSYLDAGRFDEAAATFRRISELVPSYASSRALEAAALLLQGKKKQALEAVEQEPDEAWKISISPIVYWDLGRKRESDAALRQLEEKFAASSAYNIAQMRAYRGEVEAAFRWLDRAYRQRDGGMTLVKLDPLLRNLHGDARFQEMLVKMKLDGEGPEIRH